MIKKLCTLLLCASMLFCLSACGPSKAKLDAAFNAIGNMSFADESILTADETITLADLIERRDIAYSGKDLEALEALKSEWKSFSDPIKEYIAKYRNPGFFTDSEKERLTPDEREQAELYEDLISGAYKARDRGQLDELCGEWSSYSEPIKSAFRVYDGINKEPFSATDKTLFTGDHSSKLQSLQDRTEDALTSRDDVQLQALAGEWNSFVSNTKQDLEEAKEKLLTDWVSSANLTSSITNLFSFGMITSSTSINGHKITYTTQYNTDVKTSEIKDALDSYLSLMSSSFQSGVEHLKQYIDDVCIRVEYKDKNGKVVSYKEFN